MAEYEYELVHLPGSPYSQKVLLAIEALKLQHKVLKTAYTPTLSEPGLRFRLGIFTGPVSVPVLFNLKDGSNIKDSFHIAHYFNSAAMKAAATEGSSDAAPLTLFPEEHFEEIEAWNKKSEQLLANGRTLSMKRALNDDDMLYEIAPSWSQGIRWVAIRGARLVCSNILGKYPTDGNEREVIERTLNETRVQLARGKGQYLIGDRFTYADICMICALQVLLPAANNKVMEMPNEGLRKAFTDPEFKEFQDIVQWRDSLLNTHFSSTD